MASEAAEESLVLVVRVMGEMVKGLPGAAKLISPLLGAVGGAVGGVGTAVKNAVTHQSGVSLKKLAAKGDSIDTLNIAPAELAEFKRDLKHYGVDCRIKRDKASGDYTIFFGGASRERVNTALARLGTKYVEGRRPTFSAFKAAATAASKAAEAVKDVVRNKGRNKAKGVEL